MLSPLGVEQQAWWRLEPEVPARQSRLPHQEDVEPGPET